MSDAYTLSLIGKTNPEPYEQIIVLSQKMINEAFHNMWTLADHDSPLHHFEYEERSGEYIKTDLGPPKVQLHVTTQQTQLYYLLAMNKGSLKIYTTKVKKDNDHIEWVIKDWVVAFSVTIGTAHAVVVLRVIFHVSAISTDNPEPQVERLSRENPESTKNSKSVRDWPNPTSRSLSYLLTPHVSLSID